MVRQWRCARPQQLPRDPSEATLALLKNDIQLFPIGLAAVGGHFKEGRLTALAVATEKRIPMLPEVPTMAEAGVPGFEVTVWHGVCGPARLPRPILERLNADVVAALTARDVQQRLVEQGIDAAPLSPEEFSAFIRSEVAKWAKVVKQSGARAE